MAKSRVFTSFDFDNDEDIRTMLVGQAKNPDSPFELADWSLREPLTGDWKAKIRKRIQQVDQVVILCGTQTHNASGVSVELAIAREEKKPYFLLKGRRDETCTKPSAASASDAIYNWTWENLKNLIGGAR